MGRKLTLVILVCLLVVGWAVPAVASPSDPDPLEGTAGSVTEYLYGTGNPGDVGRSIGGGAPGQVGIDAVVEPGPTIPAGYFGWVLRTPSGGVPNVSDVFNIPRYSTTYGTKSVHKGVDFGEYLGQPIYAAYGGTVSDEYTNPSDPYLAYTLIEINHGSGLYSQYQHWATASVVKNDTVTKGQGIATVGDGLGHYAAHLHFATLDAYKNFVSPAWYFDPYSNPISPSAMEFIVHTPVTSYYAGYSVTIGAQSGRPDQVEKGEVYYRANSGSAWQILLMSQYGSTWQATLPMQFTEGVSSFQYFVSFTRVFSDPLNKITGNFATRPVSEASTYPATPYTVVKILQGAPPKN